jgi:two-component system sensor histidine kinase AlgZ
MAAPPIPSSPRPAEPDEAFAKDRVRHACAVEPLIPRWAVWFYLLSPPFLSLLLHPEVYEQSIEAVVPRLMNTWMHTVAIGASLHALYTWVVPRWLEPLRDSTPRRLAIHAAAIMIGITAGLTVSAPVAYYIIGKPDRRPWWALYSSVLIASVFVAALATYQRMRRHAREVELRAENEHQAALRARIASLTARTNPHFLFNSLNTVAGLIGEDPERAEEAVERLSDLFRYTLDASRRARVPLSEEIEVVRSYLRMESLRFEDRLHYEVDVADADLGISVLPLSVQPLVENAVRHGIEERGRGTVLLRVTRDADALEISVSDDGPGPGNSSLKGSGTSMDDLRQRLELTHGSAASLETRERPTGGCEVLLRLPVS